MQKQIKEIKLYNIKKGSRIYIEDFVVIFDHLDGMYSYCYKQKDKTKILHLAGATPLEVYKDGYRIKESHAERE